MTNTYPNWLDNISEENNPSMDELCASWVLLRNSDGTYRSADLEKPHMTDTIIKELRNDSTSTVENIIM